MLQLRKHSKKIICPELAGSYLPAVADKHPAHPLVNRSCRVHSHKPRAGDDANLNRWPRDKLAEEALTGSSHPTHQAR
jgi:hypothetical protein